MSALRLTGGCLCGKVRFAATAAPLSTVACHCHDCQRYTGGAPAYQVAFRRADVTLEQGEPQRFRMAGRSGRSLERLFCAHCGAPLFTELEKLPELLIVNAGALDDPSQIKIKAHIFAASAAPWHHFEPDVPRYDGDLPPRPPRAS
jgi:hypothetical protein